MFWVLNVVSVVAYLFVNILERVIYENSSKKV